VLLGRICCVFCRQCVIVADCSAVMWLDEIAEVVEMFRGSFPLSFLFFIPLLVMISPITPAAAAHDFAVYRMQQYDLQGASRGTQVVVFVPSLL